MTCRTWRQAGSAGSGPRCRRPSGCWSWSRRVGTTVRGTRCWSSARRREAAVPVESPAGLTGPTWALAPGPGAGRGVAFAGVAAVALVYAVAALIPATRAAFQDQRYRLAVGAAMVTAFVVHPARPRCCRGGRLPRGAAGPWPAPRESRRCRRRRPSSVLFGLWHVLPSLGLNRVNPAVPRLLGTGWAGAARGGDRRRAVHRARRSAAAASCAGAAAACSPRSGCTGRSNGLGVLIAALMRRACRRQT